MYKISKELQAKLKVFREQLYQQLFEEYPEIKSFMVVRKALLWCLRILYIVNYFCTVMVMAQMNDFSQLGIEIIRLLIGLFIIGAAGRTLLGVMFLWVPVLVNLVLTVENIGLFSQIYGFPPAVVAMYFVQWVFLIVLVYTAIYLCLPSSRRYLKKIDEVEKACHDFLVSEMPELGNGNSYNPKQSTGSIRQYAMYDNSADDDSEDDNNTDNARTMDKKNAD